MRKSPRGRSETGAGAALGAIFAAELAAGAVAFYLKAYRPWRARRKASDESHPRVSTRGS